MIAHAPETLVASGPDLIVPRSSTSFQDSDEALGRLFSDITLMARRMGDVPIAMVSLLRATMGSVGRGGPGPIRERGFPRSQWWMLPGQTQAMRSDLDFSLCEASLDCAGALTEIEDLRQHAPYAASMISAAMPDVRFYASVAFGNAGGQYLGTLCLFDHKPRQLSQAQREMHTLLARQLASQLDAWQELMRLQRLALTDCLTGVGNRRAFDQHLKHEWSRHLRHSAPLSLLMNDVNHFKQYNDTHGHQAGDAALARLGELLPMPLRSSDFVARYGGDEFAVILPDTPVEGAQVVSERVQGALARASWPLQALRVSIGVATLPADGNGDFHTLMARADAAMYAAKRRT